MSLPRARSRPARTAPPDACERLSRRLEEFCERARRDRRSAWALREADRLRQARVMLFGCAPE